MARNREKTTRRAWKTIDYIGGGYVLQVMMRATVQKRKRHDGELSSADALKAEEEWKIDVNYDRRELTGHVYQRHRIVHLSELKDVNFTRFLSDDELHTLNGEDDDDVSSQ